MGEPCYGMAADATIALGDIGPLGVLSQADKDPGGPLVRALGQDDIVALAKYGLSLYHDRVPR